MLRDLISLRDVVADSSAQELVGALVIAMTVSLVMTGVYRLVRRKVSDPLVLMCGLMILASAASMALSSGHVYVRYAKARNGPGRTPGFFASQAGRGMLVRRVFEAADTDGNGRLSQDEASRAAALFVQSLDEGGEGRVDEAAVRNALRDRLSQSRESLWNRRLE
jgi:hypothetical protein